MVPSRGLFHVVKEDSTGAKIDPNNNSITSFDIKYFEYDEENKKLVVYKIGDFSLTVLDSKKLASKSNSKMDIEITGFSKDALSVKRLGKATALQFEIGLKKENSGNMKLVFIMLTAIILMLCCFICGVYWMGVFNEKKR